MIEGLPDLLLKMNQVSDYVLLAVDVHLHALPAILPNSA
jgi:hypothetical protein